MTEDRKRRVMQVESLIANEMFNEALGSIEKKYLSMITDSDFQDSYKRDFGYMGVKVIGDIKNYLQYIVKSGKLKSF